MSEMQPSVIEQLSDMHDKFDALVSYECNTGGEGSDDMKFYFDMCNKIYEKIKELQNTVKEKGSEGTK